MRQFVTALVAGFALAAMPAVAAPCAASIKGDELTVTWDRPILVERLCQSLRADDALAVRCTALTAPRDFMGIAHVQPAAERVLVVVRGARVDGVDPAAGPKTVTATCVVERHSRLEFLFSPQIVAGLIVLFGTNLLLLIAFMGRRIIAEREAHREWVTNSRTVIRERKGCGRDDFLPPQDDRFVRAGPRAVQLLASIERTVATRFKEHTTPPDKALPAAAARDLRTEVVSML